MAKKAEYYAQFVMDKELLKQLIETTANMYSNAPKHASLWIKSKGIVGYGMNNENYAMGAMAVSKTRIVALDVQTECSLDLSDTDTRTKLLAAIKASSMKEINITITENKITIKSGNVKKEIRSYTKMLSEGTAKKGYGKVLKAIDSLDMVGSVQYEDMHRYLKSAAFSHGDSGRSTEFVLKKDNLSITTEIDPALNDEISIEFTMKDTNMNKWKSKYVARDIANMVNAMKGHCKDIVMRSEDNSPLILSNTDQEPRKNESFEEEVTIHFAIAPRIDSD
jgi:HSP20 family molecular chaperone IbpA